MSEFRSVNNAGIVVIGRNEGDRLKRCFKSLKLEKTPIVYVDSGSTDGSVETAKEEGAIVVELDTTIPFTAARARNNGAQALLEYVNTTFIQFIDGDCEIVPGWIDSAKEFLINNPDVSVLGGRLREKYPEKSIYNQLCAIEWNTPVGEVQSVGGIALFRASDFVSVGMFDPTIIAGEEPELCLRLRTAGGKVVRIDTDMAVHDADISTFRQWWRRTKRSGYGSLDVATRLSDKFPSNRIPFFHMVRSVRLWTIWWLIGTLSLILLGGLISYPRGFFVCMLFSIVIWVLQALKIGIGIKHRAPNARTAIAYGFLTMVGKWAQLIGHIHHKKDSRVGRKALIIEYKQKH